MIRRWVCWLLALLGALVLRVAYTGWLAGFVLAGVLCLPALGLLASLPAILAAKEELTPGSGPPGRPRGLAGHRPQRPGPAPGQDKGDGQDRQ